MNTETSRYHYNNLVTMSKKDFTDLEVAKISMKITRMEPGSSKSKEQIKKLTNLISKKYNLEKPLVLS